MKQKCAKEALKFIKDGMCIGLGAGRTIAYLIEYLKEEQLDITIVTPSYQTRELSIQAGLVVVDTDFIEFVDLAFDGCDEVDRNFNALKSGGGIHTFEKIIGKMAKEYILLVDEDKISETLKFQAPVVFEVCKESRAYVLSEIKKMGGCSHIRQSESKDGALLSEHGMLLIDAIFDKKKINDISMFHDTLQRITGVLDISLFCNVVTKVLIAKKSGFELLEKTR